MNDIPNLIIVDFTRDRISNKDGFQTCVAWFQADQDVYQWEARADGKGKGQGLLVGSGESFIPVGSTGFFEVHYHELIFGDKDYKIIVYGRNIYGHWNDGTYEAQYLHNFTVERISDMSIDEAEKFYV